VRCERDSRADAGGAARRALRLRDVNLLLLLDADFASDGSVRLTGRRLDHVRRVLAPRSGDELRVGRLHGRLGTARVVGLDERELVLAPPELTDPPPPRAGIDLLLALPRPKVLKKVLPAIASLGVDRVILLNAARVEKSYFDARLLAPDALAGLLALGLEQARDTVPPEVLVRPRFRPFVEDECGAFLDGTGTRLVCHPAATEPVPRRDGAARVALAIGPEGGWVPFELALLAARGFRPVTLGPRVLRVETAVPALIGALR
jgi:RsmE family RNA methyltransferase